MNKQTGIETPENSASVLGFLLSFAVLYRIQNVCYKEWVRKGAYHPDLQGNQGGLLCKSTNMSTITLSKVQTSASVFHFKIKDSLKTQESIFIVNYYTRHIYSVPYLVWMAVQHLPALLFLKRKQDAK